MKKKLAILLIGVMVLSTLCSGCGTDETADDTSTAAEVSAEAEAEEVTYDTASLLAATEYDVTECVTLMDGYMNLSVEISGDYDVQSYIEENMLALYPYTVESERTVVEEGDIANIDYVGTLDGVAFDGGSYEGYDLTIGSGTFITGFEDGLIGVSVGETVDLELTFPDSYSNEDLAGQDVIFTVTVNSIWEEQYLTYEEMTDDYILAVWSSYWSTVDEMIAAVEEYMEEEIQSDVQSAVLEILEENCIVNLPEGLVENRVAEILESTQSYADTYGMEYEDFILTYYSSYASSAEEFEEYVRTTIEASYIEELILEAIVADQQITITSTVVDSFVSVRVSYYGYDSDEDFYDAYGGEDYVRLACAESQALILVAESASYTIVE